MKQKFNLVGDTFTHLTGGNKGYSVHGKESKYIEWVRHGGGENGTFYVDDEIVLPRACLDYHSYAWLLESKWICGATQRVKENPDDYAQAYDLIFTHDKELIQYNPEKFKFVPAQGSWIHVRNRTYNQDLRPKRPDNLKGCISMIASNKDWTEGHRKRLEWVERLQGKVDLYGRGFNYIENKEDGLRRYLFSVAIENGEYETYFTEKILDCFLTSTVPVYLGAPDIGDYFDERGIIKLTDNFDPDQLTHEMYSDMVPYIQENFRRALKMEVLEDYIWENYLAQ